MALHTRALQLRAHFQETANSSTIPHLLIEDVAQEV